MKKIFLALMLVFSSMAIANAQTAWDEAALEFQSSLEDNADALVEVFSAMGIDVSGSASYDASKRELIMDLRFQPELWDMFNGEAMRVAKDETINQYRQSYKTDEDFKEFVDLMKEYDGKFKVVYSCVKNGKVHTKDFTVTAKDILK